MKITVNPTFDLREGSLYTFINPFSFKVLLSAPNSTSIFEQFIIYPDGISLSKTLCIFGKKVERISFDDTSIAPSIFSLISQKKLSLGIIGSAEVTIEAAKEIISSKYSIEDIIYQSGYFSNIEKNEILRKFLACDIVISSMGTPRQEQILMDLKAIGWKGTGFTCGGYFDQLASAGGGMYYPKIIDTLNLRWAYRILKEPKRLWRRYLIDYPIGIRFFIKNMQHIKINTDQKNPCPPKN